MPVDPIVCHLMLDLNDHDDRVRFVLITGGPTGEELAAELIDFLKQICRRPDGPYRLLQEEYEVILVHGGPDLLPQFDSGLRQRALQALERAGVQVLLKTRLEEVTESHVVPNEKGKQSRLLPCGCPCGLLETSPFLCPRIAVATARKRSWINGCDVQHTQKNDLAPL